MEYTSEIRSIMERWKIDNEYYANGSKVFVAEPQCKTCKHNVSGDVFHCMQYIDENKPKYVLIPHAECPRYRSQVEIKIEVPDDLASRVYGGMFGACIGDMIGVPVEFTSRSQREEDPVRELRAYGTFHQPFGSWSDDTSLTLCLTDAINQGFSLDKVAENFIGFYQHGKYTPFGQVFDIGGATRNAIEKMLDGCNPVACGGKSERDNGNGSLMRILPLAYYVKDKPPLEQIQLVEDVSSLTHAHLRTKYACIFYVRFAMNLIEGMDKKTAYDETLVYMNQYCMDKYREELPHFENIMTKRVLEYEPEQVKSSGYVLDTLEAALWVLFHSESFEDVILNAVNLGGDTDTTASITGGLAGIYYGYKCLPMRWIQCIGAKEQVYRMFRDFDHRIRNGKDAKQSEEEVM